jgi:uncharacterized protein YaaN involved in tellurite resistance
MRDVFTAPGSTEGRVFPAGQADDDLLPVPIAEPAVPPANRIDFAKFTEAQQRQIRDIAASVSLRDTTSIMSFALEPQQRVQQALDELLKGISTHETGIAGELLIELATNVKALNLRKMQREVAGEDWVAGSLGKLPFFGQWFSAFRHFQLTHKQVLGYLETIEDKSSKEATRVRAAIQKLDRLFDVTLANIRELELYQAGGQLALESAHKEFAELATVASQKREQILNAELRDFQSQLSLFETRLERMNLGVADSLLSLPEIRLTQEAASIELGNMMDAVHFDLPKLKRRLIRFAAVNTIRDGQKSSDARRAVLRQIDEAGQEELAEAYARAKDSQGRGLEELAALTTQADGILRMIEQGAQKDIENRAIRQRTADGIVELQDRFLRSLQAQADKFVADTARSRGDKAAAPVDAGRDK